MKVEEIMKKDVGIKEAKKIEAKKVTIATIGLQTITKEGKAMKPLVHIECAHPDKQKDELIHITKIKYLRGDVVRTVGLWLQTDDDDKIQKDSAIAELLNFLNCKTLDETVGKEVETTYESDEKPFLCIKAY